jgi:hypothetical protein
MIRRAAGIAIDVTILAGVSYVALSRDDHARTDVGFRR